MKQIIKPVFAQFRCDSVDEGTFLELEATLDGQGHTLATIRMGDGLEEFWFELYFDGKIIQLPINELRKFLDEGTRVARSEKWLENNGAYKFE